AKSVVYADLKFAESHLPTTSACPTEPDETDSPYENVPLGPVPLGLMSVEPRPGRWPRHWRVLVGLLAATLLLLVAAVALGVCYWQVTHSLQDTSREHAAQQSRLSQEVSAREQSLEQTQLELAWARAELQRAWQEGNHSRLELGSRDAELGRTRQELAHLEKEMQEVQGKLKRTESTVNSLRACLTTECCPLGWVIYMGKCLFISVQKKSWWKSREHCQSRSAQLLIQGNWPSWAL
ncbi:CD72 protein, partial [Rhinopomastus cyanomelas]|nr:CD72 protein [Rhinopomastus cyanomelas]